MVVMARSYNRELDDPPNAVFNDVGAASAGIEAHGISRPVGRTSVRG